MRSAARRGLPEVKRGLVAAAGGVVRLPRRLPTGVAMELVLTGAPMSAQRALELGLVSRVTYPYNPLDAVGWHGDLAPARLNVRVQGQEVDAVWEWARLVVEVAFTCPVALVADLGSSFIAYLGGLLIPAEHRQHVRVGMQCLFEGWAERVGLVPGEWTVDVCGPFDCN